LPARARRLPARRARGRGLELQNRLAKAGKLDPPSDTRASHGEIYSAKYLLSQLREDLLAWRRQIAEGTPGRTAVQGSTETGSRSVSMAPFNAPGPRASPGRPFSAGRPRLLVSLGGASLDARASAPRSSLRLLRAQRGQASQWGPGRRLGLATQVGPVGPESPLGPQLGPLDHGCRGIGISFDQPNLPVKSTISLNLS
jgi:hypothetical protein